MRLGGFAVDHLVKEQVEGEIAAVPPENTYYLIFLNFFRGDVNLVSSVIVAAEEDPEP